MDQILFDFDAAPAEPTIPDGPLRVYTDGACSPNPGPGGWGWVLAENTTIVGSGADAGTTNQRMELAAALDALRTFAAPGRELTIVSDSKYLTDCFHKRWHAGWVRRDWVNAQGEPVKNQDLWRPIIDLALGNQVVFEWIKGHSGDRLNDRADELAVAARTTQPAS